MYSVKISTNESLYNFLPNESAWETTLRHQRVDEIDGQYAKHLIAAIGSKEGMTYEDAYDIGCDLTSDESIELAAMLCARYVDVETVVKFDENPKAIIAVATTNYSIY